MKLSLAIIVFCSLSAVLRAQPDGPERLSGRVTGKVVDFSTKEPLSGANVLVVGTQLGASTDEEGKFSIAKVPVGTYNVRVSALGYSPEVRTDVVVSTARPATLSFSLLESALSLGIVEVNAKYFVTAPDAPVSTHEQSAEEIRRLPGGFEDVVRAVSILPGVAQAQAGRNDLIVRGGAPSENLYIVDNIQVPNINHFGTQGASGGPLSFINLDFVKGTSFSTGGFGARYGDRLSSVLSINLREGRNDRVGGKATVAATQFGLNLEGPLGGSGSMLFSARRSYLDFIFRAAKFGFVPEYWDFLSKADYALSASDRLSLTAVCALDDVREFNDTPEQRYDNSKILASNQTTGVGGLSWRHLFRSGVSTVTVSESYASYDYRQSDTLQRPFFTNTSSERETSLRADAVIELSKYDEFSVGIESKLLRFTSSLGLAPFRTSYGGLFSVSSRSDSAMGKGAAFAQLSSRFGRATVTGGLRLDYFTMVSGGPVIAPRLSASWAFSAATNLNVSVGRYNQSPSSIWLLANPANRSLSFIRADQVVIGLDHTFREDTRLTAEAYLKHYSGLPVSLRQTFLVLSNTGAGYGGSTESFASFGIDPLASVGSGSARGVEFSAQKKLSAIACYGLVSLSYNESRYTGLDGVSRPGSFDQRVILNVGGGYIPDENWEFAVKFRVATGRPYTPFRMDGTQDTSLYNASRLPTHHSLDIRVDRRWSFAHWTLITYVDIQNVYNNRAVDVPVYNERTGQVEQREALGILPSIGISAEF